MISHVQRSELSALHTELSLALVIVPIWEAIGRSRLCACSSFPLGSWAPNHCTIYTASSYVFKSVAGAVSELSHPQPLGPLFLLWGAGVWSIRQFECLLCEDSGVTPTVHLQTKKGREVSVCWVGEYFWEAGWPFRHAQLLLLGTDGENTEDPLRGKPQTLTLLCSWGQNLVNNCFSFFFFF